MSEQSSIVLGLTGGIACGKSTISTYLKEKGIPVIDGDLVARALVNPGTVGLSQIVQTFGNAYLKADGTLDRAKLGSLVFANTEALDALNAITEPLLLDAFQSQINALQQHPIIVLDVALLLEEPSYRSLADVIWVVTTTEKQQLERLMMRNGYNEKEAKNRIASQMDDATRRAYADVIIDNSGSIAETFIQVDCALAALRATIQ